MSLNDLATIKDDMIAFVSGHGMRLMHAYVGEEVPTVIFEDQDADGWKVFVEHAKASGAIFLTMSEVVLEPEDVATLIGQVRDDDFPDHDALALEEAQDLMQYTGKTGYLQLGFAHQGVMFLFEAATEWYDQFQDLMETVSGLGGIVVDDGEEND